jgi:hypothetical protein
MEDEQTSDSGTSNGSGHKWLTEDALLVCGHELGHVRNNPTHDLVKIGGRRVLVDHDPEQRPIHGCPNIGATIKPCMITYKVDVGYSEFIKVQGRRVCLDTVSGFTDGTPPGTVKYKVRTAGQDIVSEAAG